MRIPRLSAMWMAMGGAWFVIGSSCLPDAPAVQVPFLGVEGLWLIWVIYSFVTVDPKVKAKREQELRVRHIRAMEKAEGLKPLELAMDDPLEMYLTETEKKEKP